MSSGSEITVEGVVGRYLDHLRVRNLTASTIYSRRCALGRLAGWAGGPILYLSEDRLTMWQAERSHLVGATTMRSELSHAREFYRWAIRERYIDCDPTMRLIMPRAPRRLPRPMRDRLLAAALQSAPADVRLILALAGFAGLRAMEIAGLDWSEVGLGERRPTIRVAGKGGHVREVPISTALAAFLMECPNRRGPVLRYRNGWSGHVPPSRVSGWANAYLHSVGVDETLHQARHRFATIAYQSCLDIRAVQTLLGHASPTTTAIYAAAADGVAGRACEAAGLLDEIDPAA